MYEIFVKFKINAINATNYFHPIHRDEKITDVIDLFAYAFDNIRQIIRQKGRNSIAGLLDLTKIGKKKIRIFSRGNR